MDVLETARELGRMLQKEESYIRLEAAQKAVEDDDDLQNQIADFNMKRYNLTQEVSNPEKNEEKLDALDKEVRDLYDEITNCEKMTAYNDAQDEFNDIFEYVLHIIQMSAAGDDPSTIEKPTEGGGCGGDCGSCGGCH